jgi:hypothetical protein
MTWLRTWRRVLFPSRGGRRASAPRRRPRLECELLEDRLVLATFLVTNTGDNGGTNPAVGAGTGTLRQAIVDADADTNSGLDTIAFAIPGTGVQTISPLNTGLPAITHAVFIDGTTQPGFAGKPLIQIEGSSGSGGAVGLDLEAGSDGSIIRDLVINRFDAAIFISGSNNNHILGNYLGTDYTGSLALGDNTGVSINDGGGNVIGGTTAAARNVISGNAFGVNISSDVLNTVSGNNVVEGNYIGTDPSGTQPLGNGFGIEIPFRTSQNVIGGTAPGAGNLIAFNGQFGEDSEGGSGTSVLGNTIFANGGRGIDLNQAGQAPNTPNGAQNFPALQSAVTSGGVTAIRGTLNSTPSTTFRLEFFANPAPDPSGFGQGQTFLGAINVTTDGNGNAAFTAVFAAVPVGEFLSATSTGPAGTSEFAQDVQVTTPPAPPPSPSPAPAQPPVLTAFFAPAPRGEVAVSGFVLDPAGQLRGLPLVVVINWGDGRESFTGLFATASGFDFFVPQAHKKAKGHRQITVHVEELVPTGLGLADVVAPFVLST